MDENGLRSEGWRYEGWRVAAGSAVGVFFSTLLFYTFAVFLKPLSADFGWSREALSSAYGLMAATAAVCAPLWGHLLDRVGTRRIAVPCLVLAGCAFASLAALTPRLGHLYAVFAVLGVAASGTTALPYSRAVSTWFDRRRGAALALVMSGAAVGGIVHPPAAQALLGLAGWRGAYLALGGLILAVALPTVLRFVRERASAGAGPMSANGLSVREGLGSRAFWILVLMVFAGAIANNAAIVHLAALLTDRGVPGHQAAIAVSTLGGATLAGRLLTGWLLDRFHAPRVAFAMLVLVALGMFLFAGARSFPAGVLAAVLIGFGIGGEYDVAPYLLSRYFGLRSLSTLYGLTWTGAGLGAAAGPILLGRAFDATGSYEAVLVQLAATLLGVATLLLALPACPASSCPDLSSCPDPTSSAR